MSSSDKTFSIFENNWRSSDADEWVSRAPRDTPDALRRAAFSDAEGLGYYPDAVEPPGADTRWTDDTWNVEPTWLYAGSWKGPWTRTPGPTARVRRRQLTRTYGVVRAGASGTAGELFVASHSTPLSQEAERAALLSRPAATGPSLSRQSNATATSASTPGNPFASPVAQHGGTNGTSGSGGTTSAARTTGGNPFASPSSEGSGTRSHYATPAHGLHDDGSAGDDTHSHYGAGGSSSSRMQPRAVDLPRPATGTKPARSPLTDLQAAMASLPSRDASAAATLRAVDVANDLRAFMQTLASLRTAVSAIGSPADQPELRSGVQEAAALLKARFRVLETVISVQRARAGDDANNSERVTWTRLANDTVSLKRALTEIDSRIASRIAMAEKARLTAAASGGGALGADGTPRRQQGWQGARAGGGAGFSAVSDQEAIAERQRAAAERAAKEEAAVQVQLQAYDEAAMIEAEVNERAEHIDEIATAMNELAETFRDLGAIVNEQGHGIEKIETNLQSAEVRVKDGVQQLHQADKLQAQSQCSIQ